HDAMTLPIVTEIIVSHLRGAVQHCHLNPGGVRRGIQFAIERGWLTMHESGTFVKFKQAGADLFA
ncbi:hypothetical protein ACQR09_32630, partial [Bradyrhizobium oligotrophicum]